MIKEMNQVLPVSSYLPSALVVTSLLLLGLTKPAFADKQPDNNKTQQTLAIHYSLAKAFEEKSLLAMSKAEAFIKKYPGNVSANIEFRNAFLYALEAQRWPLPKDKKAIAATSLQRLLTIKKHALTTELFQTPHYKRDYNKEPVVAEKLEGHSRETYGIAYSPDGQFLASNSEDKTIRIWDAITKKTIKVIQGEGYSSNLVYSPDGINIAADSDNNIKIWNAKTAELQHTLRGHTDVILDIAYSPDGKIIASNSRDNTLRLWNAESGKIIKVTEIKQATDIAFNSEGNKIIVSLPETDNLSIISTDSDKVLQTLDTDDLGSPRAITYSPDGKLIAAGFSEPIIKIWNADSGKPISIFNDHATSVREFAFSPDGSKLAVVYNPPYPFSNDAPNDDFFKIWDVESGQITKVFGNHQAGNYEASVHSVAFSPDGNTVATSSQDGAIRFWKLDPLIMRHIAENAFVYSPNSTQIAVVINNKIQFRKASTGLTTGELEGHKGELADNIFDRFRPTPIYSTTVYSPDGKTIASVSDKTTINFWNLESEKVIRSHTFDVHTVDELIYHPDGKSVGVILSTVLYDPHPQSKILNLESGKIIDLVTNGKVALKHITFSHDGKLIAAYVRAEQEWYLGVWDTESGKPIKKITNFSGGIESLVFSPDNTMIFFFSHDFTRTGEFQDVRSIFYINAADLKSESTIKEIAHRDYLNDMDGATLTFNTDGKTFVTSFTTYDSRSHVTEIWRTQDLKVTDRFDHKEAGYGAITSPDGKSLLIPKREKGFDITRLDSPLYRLIYDFDAAEVSDVLQFLWELKLDGITFKHNPRAKSLAQQNGRHFIWTDETQKFQPLMEMPPVNQGKLDQVVSWLETRCAYKNPELYGCKP